MTVHRRNVVGDTPTPLVSVAEPAAACPVAH